MEKELLFFIPFFYVFFFLSFFSLYFVHVIYFGRRGGHAEDKEQQAVGRRWLGYILFYTLRGYGRDDITT